MKLDGLKYVLIACIAIAFFLKLSHAVSYLRCSTDGVEVLSTNDDATEKEEKKVETEYAVQQIAFHGALYLPFQTSNKVLIPEHSFQPAYFPEVLTPPPSV
ncbi:hypothetical protein HDC90_002404 [Pedobacter sp. AK013]|uniref:hypothetical protein n=1 Tax=Pedobacter sp. AK013 TaxID=2723071 RepID=UPI0016113576|nr:hypothetical protein [Pedobacter sp. AK013]MBB6237782.1 hypothetical protein [Pedobacter sp. AK013]